jgi:hypothetical protein
MNEPEPAKQKQPNITEIDPEVYKKLCEVVEAGTFRSVSFSPWHKGCDTELNATCDWDDLQDEMESWYYDNQEDFGTHTYATVVPYYNDKKLIFDVSAYWDRGMDQVSELGEGWDDVAFQDFVYNLLPSKMKKQTSSEDLWISVDVDYESPDQLSISAFSISESGDEEKDLAATITPKNEKLIAEYILNWCQENHGPEDNFSITIENNEVGGVESTSSSGGESSSSSEEFLIVPKKTESTKP